MTKRPDQFDKKWVPSLHAHPLFSSRTHRVSRLFAGAVVCSGDPHTRLIPSRSPLICPFFLPSAAVTNPCLLLQVGHDELYAPPDPAEIEPPMLPPYVHATNPRSCCSPLLMLSACLDAASLLMVTGIERLHGAFFERCQTGGALRHGTGPWDDVTSAFKRATVEDFSENFVFVDMKARTLAVGEWMVGPQLEPIMNCSRERRTAWQLMRIQRIQQTSHDA